MNENSFQNGPMNTIRCSRCGCNNNYMLEYCDNCGNRLRKKKGYLVASIILFIFAFVNFLIFFISTLLFNEFSEAEFDKGGGLSVVIIYLFGLVGKYLFLFLFVIFLILGIVFLICHISKNKSR